MDCKEYRTAFNAALDRRDPGSLAPEYRSHPESCQACKAWTANMLLIDEELHAIAKEPVEVPDELMEKVGQILAKETHVVQRGLVKTYTMRAAVAIVPGIALAIIFRLLPGVPSEIPTMLFPAAGALMLLLGQLARPRMGDATGE